jgi:glutathione S-transferase
MIDLDYRSLACSLAARIALYEAGLEARFIRVDFPTKRLADGSDFRAISAKGQVPVLRTGAGELVTEGVVVLQYIADQNPAARLAPPPWDPRRYALQTWLNFIATELHKQFLFPQFTDGTQNEVREHGRRQFLEKLPIVTEHLRHHDVLGPDDFSVADVYLVWVLTLAKFAGVELTDELRSYLERAEQRPAVVKAREIEIAELQDGWAPPAEERI